MECMGSMKPIEPYRVSTAVHASPDTSLWILSITSPLVSQEQIPRWSSELLGIAELLKGTVDVGPVDHTCLVNRIQYRSWFIVGLTDCMHWLGIFKSIHLSTYTILLTRYLNTWQSRLYTRASEWRRMTRFGILDEEPEETCVSPTLQLLHRASASSRMTFGMGSEDHRPVTTPKQRPPMNGKTPGNPKSTEKKQEFVNAVRLSSSPLKLIHNGLQNAAWVRQCTAPIKHESIYTQRLT
jgi:hypothetical protein